MLKRLLQEKGYNIKKLSEAADIPYSTLNDLVNHRKEIENCSVALLVKLARCLNMSIEDLYYAFLMKEERELQEFKKQLLVEVEEAGTEVFFMKRINSNMVGLTFKENKNKGAYELAFLDYLNHTYKYVDDEILQENQFKEIRKYKAVDAIYLNTNNRFDFQVDYLPEFLNFNLMETDAEKVTNVNAWFGASRELENAEVSQEDETFYDEVMRLANEL